MATIGHPAATARISRNRAPTLRATTTIARHPRTAPAARMTRRLARTAIARHPPTPRRAAAIRRLRVRTLRHRAPTRLQVAVTPHLRTRHLRARTPLPAAATLHQVIVLVAVAEAIAAAVVQVEVAARMVAAVVEGAVPIAAVVAAEDRTVAVAVHAAAAPTATNSRSSAKGRLQSRSGPFAFPSRHAKAVRPNRRNGRLESFTTLLPRKCLIA
jgi:hypothetical protein